MENAGEDRNDVKLTELLVEILSQHPKGMAVNQIYSFLSKHNKMFDLSDKKWQGNVRHILSKKAYFEKTNHKEPTQRGRFWIFNKAEYHRAKQRANLPDALTTNGSFNDTPQNTNLRQVQATTFDQSVFPERLEKSPSTHQWETSIPANRNDPWNHNSDYAASFANYQQNPNIHSLDNYSHRHPSPGRFLVGCSQTINFNFVPGNIWNSSHLPQSPSAHQPPSNRFGLHPSGQQFGSSMQPFVPGRDNFPTNDPYSQFNWNYGNPAYDNQHYQ